MTTSRDETFMSIGAVSKATGIPKETLRTWERRYDFPKPQRSSTGHRRYSSQIIEPLKLIYIALEQGHRPSQVVGQDVETLRQLLDVTTPNYLSPVNTSPNASPEDPLTDTEQTIARWMKLLNKLDQEQLRADLEHAWFELGPRTFLTDLISPFLNEVGQAWHEGRIAVFHEQFASLQLRDFLSTQWGSISARSNGPNVLLATLPGEYHLIGLHMAACIMAVTGYQIHLLGADLQPPHIAQAAEQTHAAYVLISISSAANTSATTRHIQTLRALLPENIGLILGGSGAPERFDPEHTKRIMGLDDLYHWARDQHLPKAQGASS